jgi:hypothetical protein
MKWEVDVVDIDIVFLLELFNTPGTEIAPGSNEIGKNIKRDRFRHLFLGYSVIMKDGKL